MTNIKTLSVRKVGFYGKTGDNRSPEDFPFPACMTSLMEYIGEDVKWETHNDNGHEWTQRFLNKEILAASGMAFGLLWSREYCSSCMDLMQVQEHDNTIRHAFDFVGYDFSIIEKTPDTRDEIKAKIVTSIDNNLPVLAFGIIGPPECAIICGYENGGDLLLGWSPFADEMPCDKAENGMFRVKDWLDGLWKIILVGKKKEKNCNLEDIIRRGVAIMKKAEQEGYAAGTAAYDEWMKFVQNDELITIDDDILRQRHSLHHCLVGNHAEARCYLGNFLMDRANGDKTLISASQCCQDIHNACWNIWGVLGKWNDPSIWTHFRDADKRHQIADFIADMRVLDTKVLQLLEDWLVKS